MAEIQKNFYLDEAKLKEFKELIKQQKQIMDKIERFEDQHDLYMAKQPNSNDNSSDDESEIDSNSNKELEEYLQSYEKKLLEYYQQHQKIQLRIDLIRVERELFDLERQKMNPNPIQPQTQYDELFPIDAKIRLAKAKLWQIQQRIKYHKKNQQAQLNFPKLDQAQKNFSKSQKECPKEKVTLSSESQNYKQNIERPHKQVNKVSSLVKIDQIPNNVLLVNSQLQIKQNSQGQLSQKQSQKQFETEKIENNLTNSSTIVQSNQKIQFFDEIKEKNEVKKSGKLQTNLSQKALGSGDFKKKSNSSAEVNINKKLTKYFVKTTSGGCEVQNQVEREENGIKYLDIQTKSSRIDSIEASKTQKIYNGSSLVFETQGQDVVRQISFLNHLKEQTQLITQVEKVQQTIQFIRQNLKRHLPDDIYRVVCGFLDKWHTLPLRQLTKQEILFPINRAQSMNFFGLYIRKGIKGIYMGYKYNQLKFKPELSTINQPGRESDVFGSLTDSPKRLPVYEYNRELTIDQLMSIIETVSANFIESKMVETD